MKAKYHVHWWCEKTDAAKKRGFHTYTEALEFEFKMKAKTNGNVRLTGRSA